MRSTPWSSASMFPPSGWLAARWENEPNTIKRNIRSSRLVPDEFVQIAIVYEGRQVRIYRNGAAYASYDMPESPQVFDKTATILIGPRHRSNMRDCFLGKIRDARIYPGALDAKTIAALRPGQPLDGVQPWAWWDFTAGQVNDRTGNWKLVRMRGDIRVQDNALVIGPKHGSFLARMVEPTPALPKFTYPTTLDAQLRRCKTTCSSNALRMLAPSRG